MVSDTVVVGVLTFFGTVLATSAGLWQWQRANAREAKAHFRARRVEALREVWEALSDLEEVQRASLSEGDEQAADGRLLRLRKVNLLVLRSSPFLRPDEQEWAQSFAQHVVEIDTLVRAGLLDDRRDAEWWERSAPMPAATHVAARAAGQLQSLRAELGNRYAAVVRGDHE